MFSLIVHDNTSLCIVSLCAHVHHSVASMVSTTVGYGETVSDVLQFRRWTDLQMFSARTLASLTQTLNKR